MILKLAQTVCTGFGARIAAFIFILKLAWGRHMSVLDTACISAAGGSDRLENLQFVSFDVETTGLSAVVARLVELSGVKFSLNKEEVTTFSSLIDPEMAIPPEVSRIHGITDDMVADAPTCATVVPDFLNWIGDENTVLVAHNAPFDVEFLHVAMARLRLNRPANFVIDTLPFARNVLTDAPNHQLKTLVEHLQLEAGGYHRALADSHHVRNVLSRLFEKINAQTWSEVCHHGCVFKFDADPSGFEPPQELLEAIASINEAIVNGTPISFVYNGYRSSRRSVDPVALIQSRGNFYLTAYCRRVLEERTFRLDKISQLKSMEGDNRRRKPAEAAS